MHDEFAPEFLGEEFLLDVPEEEEVEGEAEEEEEEVPDLPEEEEDK